MEKSIKLELKEDKIIDILMHAATREDIAAVRNELKDEIASVKNELKDEIVGVKTQVDKLNDKIDKVIWFIVISILVPILIQVIPHLLK